MIEPSPFAQTEDTFLDLRRAARDATPLPFADLQRRIADEVARSPYLGTLRDFNRMCVRALAGQYTPGQTAAIRILDVGASIHGFALEAALDEGFHSYVGIDLAVRHNWKRPVVAVGHGQARSVLCQMDAHCLWFEDASFDAVICLSGFEHYLFPEGVLSEIKRVLRPGGLGLITYEPIWTCSYGHHLHHFGLTFDQVRPWAHLLYDRAQFFAALERVAWPAECPIDRAEATEWTFGGREINRRDVRFHSDLLDSSNFTQVLWRLPIADESPIARAAAPAAAQRLPYSEEQLLTRGFSVCFRR